MTDRTVSPVTFVLTFIGLSLLTLGTVSLSFLKMGPAGHVAVGLCIGITKASLVVLFFMHLIRSPARHWLAAGLGLFWLGILIALSLSDYLFRYQASY